MIKETTEYFDDYETQHEGKFSEMIATLEQKAQESSRRFWLLQELESRLPLEITANLITHKSNWNGEESHCISFVFKEVDVYRTRGANFDETMARAAFVILSLHQAINYPDSLAGQWLAHIVEKALSERAK